MFDPNQHNQLEVNESPIAGLFVINLPVHGDSRGWFKENYQKEKMQAAGLPAFKPVQNNFSFNKEVGVTRGLHAEPWDKYISVANGSVFGAWVDLRAGKGFGQVFSAEINPGVAIYVPRGVANGYQTLEENVAYAYLVNAHWSPQLKYVAINVADPELDIAWPTDLDQAIVSEKDKNNPMLQNINPVEIV